MGAPTVAIGIRRARPDEGRDIADVWLRSRASSVPAIPAPVHPPDEVRSWFAEVVLPTREVWVAEADSTIVGLLVLEDDWLDQLYVEPGRTGAGIGGVLLGHAQRCRPEGLQLWTFQSNTGARRFYERHGFVAVEETDGDNEEGAPDVRYEWRGHTPATATGNRRGVRPVLGVMDTTALRSLVDDRQKGVLTTLKRDGRPQLSNVLYVVVDDVLRISTTDDRAKTANLRRDPRASLHVASEDFWSYAVVEGTVTLTDVAQSPDDDTADQLVEYYRRVNGEHDDWEEYRRTMVDDRRLLVHLPIDHIYGMA